MAEVKVTAAGLLFDMDGRAGELDCERAAELAAVGEALWCGRSGDTRNSAWDACGGNSSNC